MTPGAGAEDDALTAALLLVQTDPERARTQATAALRVALRAGDRARQSAALRVLGLACRELSDAVHGLRHLRRAVRVADAAALPRRAAEARMSLALLLAEAGRPTEALRQIDAAAPVLDGLARARLTMQRALILDRLSRFDEAMDGYTTALGDLRRAGDQLWEARTLTNRGVLHAYRGSISQAEADLLQAGQLYEALGQEQALAQVRHNLGFVLARSGDVPGALRWFDHADEYFARTTRPAIALMDRGEVLLDARLLPEARAAAEAALAAARAGRMRLFEAQARLMLAETALAEGDRTTAGQHAAAAHRAFVRQDRPAWSALARYVELRAGAPRPRQARAVAAALDAAGWPTPALDARLYAVRLTLDALGAMSPRARVNGLRLATGELRGIRAAAARGPAHLRARAWHAEALLRDATGDEAGARRALLAGMRVLHRYSAALGATELRILAGSHAIELADTGLRLARRTGQPRTILWWGERWKAAALRLPPVRPPDERALAVDLAVLRRVHAEAQQPGPRAPALLREQRELEERIRRRSWQASGNPGAPDPDRAGPDASLRTLVDRLGDQAFVELFDTGGILHAVVRSGRGFQALDLGRVAEADSEVEALRFALRRIVTGHGSAASAAAAREAARYGIGRLDELIFGPLRRRLGDRALVLVPSGALHATPWALLPTCHGRPVTVAPSASSWLAATASAGRPTPSPKALLVAGPGLDHAEPEVRRLETVVEQVTVLVGADAGVEAVAKALDGTALAHIASHGVFRADNPMFSHLRLADGPLTVYDLERLGRAPRTVVLSACNVGLSAVHPGEELMGLTAALLGLGTATVLAGVLPAHDAATQDLMVDLHVRLAAGVGPAEALAAAQAGQGGELDELSVTAAAFVCFGAG